jgi:hypothetical protein
MEGKEAIKIHQGREDPIKSHIYTKRKSDVNVCCLL